MIGLEAIVDELAAQANSVASTAPFITCRNVAFGPATAPRASATPPDFKPFTTGAKGNFPYYWQSPQNLEFNAKTYAWIESNLKANTSPVQLGQIFTNLYIQALSSVSYSLSTSDQAKLAQNTANTINQQGALLSAWRDAFGSIPKGTGTQQPIDLVLQEITHGWALPPTTLERLQNSLDLQQSLNKIPSSGRSVLPALSNYLSAIDNSISLINATTMNNGYLSRALAAAQNPSLDNGALTISDGWTVPAYAVATPLPQILRDLNATPDAAAPRLKMSVGRSFAADYSVAINGGRSIDIAAADFLTIATDRSSNLFHDAIVDRSKSTEVEVAFNGTATVYFGPVAFSMPLLKNWFWTDPIEQAVKNAGQDVSGFKFSPVPQIDFSPSGPFGLVTGVVISRNPSLSISAESGNYKAIAQDMESAQSVRLKFLGRPMGSRGEDSDYTISTKIDATASTVKLDFEQSPTASEDTMDSTAFVLGVQTSFPAA